MKLVDILVKNLVGWPVPTDRYHDYCVDGVVQDPSSSLYVHYSCDDDVYREENEWREVWYHTILSNLEVQLAEDHATAIVTKQMWLAAKAATERKETSAELDKINSLDPNSTEYKIAVMQHYLNGGDVEVKGKFEGNDGWLIWTMSYEPQWSWHDSDFRIKPEPVEPAYSLPEIPWDMIEDKYKWFAFDGDEDNGDQVYGYLYEYEPNPSDDEYSTTWYTGGGSDVARVDGLKFNKGNAPWNKSLVKRPD